MLKNKIFRLLRFQDIKLNTKNVNEINVIKTVLSQHLNQL